MKPYQRTEKISELVREKISPVIQEFTGDIIFSVTEVETSADLSYCDISISLLDDDEKFVQNLNHNTKKLRKELSQILELQRVPYLRFHLDKKESAAERIDKLLNS